MVCSRLFQAFFPWASERALGTKRAWCCFTLFVGVPCWSKVSFHFPHTVWSHLTLVSSFLNRVMIHLCTYRWFLSRNEEWADIEMFRSDSMPCHSWKVFWFIAKLKKKSCWGTIHWNPLWNWDHLRGAWFCLLWTKGLCNPTKSAWPPPCQISSVGWRSRNQAYWVTYAVPRAAVGCYTPSYV